MRTHFLAVLSLLLLVSAAQAADSPPAKNLDTPRDFPHISTPSEWQTRARQIREQILVSAGLWPMPEKTPLHAVIFGKIIRDGYSVEKVYFQTYPGFYLAGNLYRPNNAGHGPFPALLSPHGHWENGRLADNPDCSIPGRCINFARQGIIAFSYDMIGYNDTQFAGTPANMSFSVSHHSFATNNPAAQLWSISQMGLQTWNSIRALDFLESLPDVDPRRLACTGESGGGTQTFMLGAIDDRLAAQAPVVMVSHTMQGGCTCENMPGLRVQFSNMEIAAAASPRPQILVGATGDWTTTMTNVEGPAVQHIYDLLQRPQNLRVVEFDFHHNYNQTSRQAVYQWFDKTLLHQPDAPVQEIAFKKEPDRDLRVFRDNERPFNAVTQDQLIHNLIKDHQSRLQALQPTDQTSWANYKETMFHAWQATLQLEIPAARFHATVDSSVDKSGYTAKSLSIRNPSSDKTIKFKLFSPAKKSPEPNSIIVVLVNPQPSPTFLDPSAAPIGLARRLLDKQYDVAVLENTYPNPSPDELSIFYSCYNRTRLQEQTGDLITLCHTLKEYELAPAQKSDVVLLGTGQGAFWSLLAAPAADAVIADCGQLDVSDDKQLLAPGLFCPGIRNIDSFSGALILAAPHPLLIHNTANKFPTAGLRSTYQALDSSAKFKTESRKLTDPEIIKWISQLDQ